MTEVTELTAPAGATPNTQEVLLNLGPQHPSTHGVLRLVLEMEAEIRRARRPPHRLSPPGHREAGRELHLHADLPADRPARLSLPALQQPRLRAGGREAPRHRGAGAGAVHPRADGRAGAALRPPADHRRAADGPRRDDRAALRHARARDDHGPHGDDHRRAHAHLVLPGRRRARGPDRRAHRQDPGVLRDLPEPDPRLRAAARQEPGVPEAHARHRRDHARGRHRPRPQRPEPARLGRRLGYPPRRALRDLRPAGLQRHHPRRGRLLRPLAVPRRRDAREREDHRAVPRPDARQGRSRSTCPPSPSRWTRTGSTARWRR